MQVAQAENAKLVFTATDHTADNNWTYRVNRMVISFTKKQYIVIKHVNTKNFTSLLDFVFLDQC